MRLTFDIYVPSERAAGIRGMTDTVIVEVESGNPGGAPGEFESHMKEALEAWYDGGTATVRT